MRRTGEKGTGNHYWESTVTHWAGQGAKTWERKEDRNEKKLGKSRGVRNRKKDDKRDPGEEQSQGNPCGGTWEDSQERGKNS